MSQILNQDWDLILEEEGYKSSWRAQIQALTPLYKDRCIYPSQDRILRAFQLTDFFEVKVVILGQDPYHGPEQAQGLSFAVQNGMNLPPSLRNIFQEIASNFDQAPRSNGDLSDWAAQGVFLLNSILTVEKAKPLSHKHLGWEELSDQVIRTLSDRRQHLVFMLWGNFAKKKAQLIDAKRHLVLEAQHPSPLSAYRGFFGCQHFKLANQYLQASGITAIKW